MHTKIRAMDKMLINNNNFKFFFQEYFEPVFQFARKYTENDAIARDFTQDAFIKLYEKRKDFDVIEKAKSFLYTTTRNLCLNHLKHKKIEHQYFQEVKIEDEEAEEQFYLEEVTYQETLRILRAAIDQLPPQTREVILVSLDGKNNNEIAETLDISVNTVKTLKKNAYKSLRESLGSRNLYILLFLLKNNLIIRLCTCYIRNY